MDKSIGRHIVGMIVEDKPGVMQRIAGMFTRRGFNIETIAVGATETPGRARITLSGMQFVMITVWISFATSWGIWPPEENPFTRAFASPSQAICPSI